MVEKIIATKINDKETEIEIIFRLNHPSIKMLVDFRKTLNKKKLETKKRTGKEEEKEKESVFSKMLGFVEQLYLGIAHSAQSPFLEIIELQ